MSEGRPCSLSLCQEIPAQWLGFAYQEVRIFGLCQIIQLLMKQQKTFLKSQNCYQLLTYSR